jgi:hypothetical protein
MSLYADGAWRGRRPGRSGGFNQSGNSLQANPNKSKQKSLDFLGFIRPNRDFSMGYEQKNKKIDSRLRLCAKRLRSIPTSLLFPLAPTARLSDSGTGKSIAHLSGFRKKIHHLPRKARRVTTEAAGRESGVAAQREA